MSDVRATIETNNQKFLSAFRRGDAAGVAALYTQNAYALPPGSDVIQGREAIQAFWQTVMDNGAKGGELKTLDVETGGDNMAREIGRYVLTFQQGNETTNIAGKYVVIWKQENGEWKLDVDIWNS
jgi:uncharacterized protein (TIGR02246 family)